MHHYPHHTWTVAGMAGSFGSGTYAVLSGLPGGTWLAVVGTFGSMAVPVVVALINRNSNREVVRLQLVNQQLRAERDRAFDKLTEALARVNP